MMTYAQTQGKERTGETRNGWKNVDLSVISKYANCAVDIEKIENRLYMGTTRD